ncbi:MAG: cytochrome c3 family protein [Coriobacteriia bacterium]
MTASTGEHTGSAATSARTPTELGGRATSGASDRVKNGKPKDKAKPPKSDPPVDPPDDPVDPPGDPVDPPDDPVDPPVDPDPPAAAPGAPTLTACTSGDMADVVAFDPAAEGGPVAAFSLLRAATSDGTYSVVATAGPEARSFVYPVAECGTAYYAVSAEGPGGTSSPSASAPNARVSISGEVTPEGRILRASNGEVALALAPGSYAGTTTVTIEELAGTPTGPFVALAGIYDIEPSGSLGAPATLSIAYTLDVEQAQIVSTLLRAAGLMTYDTATASWVRVADARLEGGYLTGELSHFSPYTNGTYQPHGTSGLAVNYCQDVCHDLTAPTNADIRLDARDAQVCYFCHGNEPHTATAAGVPGARNIEAEFFDVLDQPLPATRTTHPVDQGLYCTSCHDPHKNPYAAGNEDLLRAYDAVSGAAVTGGDAFCWTCHGIARNRRVAANILLFRPGYDYFTATGGDHKTGYATSAHAGVMQNGSVTCTNCHGPHGGSEESLLPARQFSACTGATGNACHSDAANSAGGSNIKAQLTAGGTNDLTHHDVDPAAQARTGARIECTSCHNVHRNSVTAAYSDPDDLRLNVDNGLSDFTDASGFVYALVGAKHDGVAPVVSQVTLDANSGVPVVAWSTDEPATSRVDLGTTDSYGSGSFGGGPLTTAHSVALGSLSAGPYHLRIRSADALANEAQTADFEYESPNAFGNPTLVPMTDRINSQTVTFQWSAIPPADGHAVQYYVELYRGAGTVPWKTSSWQTGTSWAAYVTSGSSYTWRVCVRDSGHFWVMSPWSGFDDFGVTTSCPILYTWNGTQYEFITDVMGFGTLGIRQGDSYRWPPPVEETRIDGSSIAEADGQYHISLKDEKDEVEYIDHVILSAVDHPAGTDVYLNDYTRSGTTKTTPTFDRYTVRDPRPVEQALYTRTALYTGPAVTNLDITSEVASVDAVHAPSGFFDDNQYTFDLGDLTGAPSIKLLVNGWTEYATATERAQWEESGAPRASRVFEVQDAEGNWVVVDPALPFIPGYTKTVIYDLTGKFPEGVTRHKVRMRGFYRTWIDWVAVDTSAAEPITVTELELTSAQLGFTGAAAYDDEPLPEFDYESVATSDIPTHLGAFTRYGDVEPLVGSSDDMFVVMDTGDELKLTFGAVPVPQGMERTYVIHTDGYFQELTGRVDPMPFHAMTNWPYGPDEVYPEDEMHQAYLTEWNTRIHDGTYRTSDAAAGGLAALISAYSEIVGHAPLGVPDALTVIAPTSTAGPPAETEFSVDTDRVTLQLEGAGGAVTRIPASDGWESSGPLPTITAPGSAVDAAALSAASTLDATYWRTDLASSDGDWNWQVVRFPVSGIAAVRASVEWTGHGEPTPGYPVRVTLYDFSDSAWVEGVEDEVPTDRSVLTPLPVGNTVFCLRCHDGAAPPGVVAPASLIDVGAAWGSDYHGDGDSAGANLKYPFVLGNQAITCGVCHDSHGNGNLYHIATTVNGTTDISVTSSSQLDNLCVACHAGTVAEWHSACYGCHSLGGAHGSPWIDSPEVPAAAGFPNADSNCQLCHNHGSRSFVNSDAGVGVSDLERAMADPSYGDHYGCHSCHSWTRTF